MINGAGTYSVVSQLGNSAQQAISGTGRRNNRQLATTCLISHRRRDGQWRCDFAGTGTGAKHFGKGPEVLVLREVGGSLRVDMAENRYANLGST